MLGLVLFACSMLPPALEGLLPDEMTLSANSVLEIWRPTVLLNCVDVPEDSEKRADWDCPGSTFDCTIKFKTIAGSIYKVEKDCDGDPVADYDPVLDKITFRGEITLLTGPNFFWFLLD
jgi:hypothetical protein